MKILSDYFYLEKGEVIPFMCPQCSHVIEYHDCELVRCMKCQFLGTGEEFSDFDLIPI